MSDYNVTRAAAGKVTDRFSKMLLNAWRIWAKSLGEKIGDTDTQANAIAAVRTFWWVVHIITCFMIIIHNGAKLGWWL